VELSNKNLTRIPEAVWSLTTIQSLILSENKLVQVPSEIGNLHALKVLNLSYNNISELPDAIGELENLVELNLHSNSLTHLPESIGKLSKLELLWVSQNQLSSLPNISSLPVLNQLSVAFNNAGLKLPNELASVKFMTWIDISGNKYESLPELIFYSYKFTGS